MLSSAGQFVRFIEGWSQGEGYLFCSLSDERYAVGCREGTILICDKDGNVLQKLIGHQAAVTAIFRKGNKLFSSSYDCTLRLWDLHKGKTESAVIMTSSGWIHTFCLHPDGTSIFMGRRTGPVISDTRFARSYGYCCPSGIATRLHAGRMGVLCRQANTI